MRTLALERVSVWLQAHITILEGTEDSRRALLQGLEYLVQTSFVDDDEVLFCLLLSCAHGIPALVPILPMPGLHKHNLHSSASYTFPAAQVAYKV